MGGGEPLGSLPTRLAKLDHGDQVISQKFKKQDIKETIQRALVSISNKMDDKEIKLDDASAGIDVYGNHGLLEEAIRNLLENAINYSPKGSNIEIKSLCCADCFELHIKDYGIGIPPKDCHRIFERFYRVDKSRDRHTGGSGLGLAIVKHIINIHQGSVSVESQEGEGSLFKINIPVNHNV